MATRTFDVAVVGSGFAGTILARCLNAAGRRVLLVERGRHPRFALGESSTPLASFCLERLAARYRLPDLRQLATYGRWGEYLPGLRRGLKRGFTFYQHRPGEPFRNSATNEARLLIAASPEDRLADCHWLRSDVDHHLVQRALAEGVQYRDGVELEEIHCSAADHLLRGRRSGKKVRFRARWVVDASGPGGFLARQERVLPAELEGGQRDLLYAHFRGLRPFGEVASEAELPAGPYPDEKAAVHHLLREGWMYQLPFDHGVTSCGLVLKEGFVPEALLARPEAAWREVLAAYPSLAAQFEAAEPLGPIAYRSELRYRLRCAAGERTALLPHAYAFSDPLFSTGMAWSLLGVERLAHVLTLGSRRSSGEGLDEWSYEELLAEEADQIDTLVEAAYLAMGDFELFTAVAGLYFVVVSFLEVEQRLMEGELARDLGWWGFLQADEPRVAEIFRETLDRLRRLEEEASETARDELLAWLAEAIAPWNVAGLGEPSRRNLYPVDLDLLVERAHLLGKSREEITAALPRLRGDE